MSVKAADLLRSLQMMGTTLDFARRAFEAESEKNAAIHMASKVVYSPIVTGLDEAQKKLNYLLLELELDDADPMADVGVLP